MERAGLHHARRIRRGVAQAASGWTAATSTRRSTQPYFFDYVQQQLIDKYGVNTVAQRRAQGLHDDRPAAAGGRRAGGRRAPSGLPAGRRGARLDRRRQRRRSWRWPPRSRIDDQPVQLRRRRPPPAGVLVQALRARGRGQPGDRPRHDLLLGRQPDHADPARRRRPWTVNNAERAAGSMDLRDGDGRLRQHRLRPARPRRRPRGVWTRWPTSSGSRAHLDGYPCRGESAD